MTDNTVNYQPTLSNANESREKALKALEKAKEANKGRTVPVKIDSHTTILIRPGEDPGKAKIRYLALLKKSGSGYFKNIQ